MALILVGGGFVGKNPNQMNLSMYVSSRLRLYKRDRLLLRRGRINGTLFVRGTVLRRSAFSEIGND